MITRVHVKNFRSLADVDVELGPLTVLVGRNGAGKSAFLDVLRFVRDALWSGLENAISARNGIASLRRWVPRKPCDIEIAVTVEGTDVSGQYAFAIGSGKEDTYHVVRESCHVSIGMSTQQFETNDGKWTVAPEFSVSGTGAPHTLKGVAPEAFARLRNVLRPSGLVLPSVASLAPGYPRLQRAMLGNFYHIFPNTLREPQKPSSQLFLGDSGENFASSLREIRKTPSSFADIVAALRRIVDGVGDLRLRKIGGYLVTQLRHDDVLLDGGKKRQAWFDLSQESDGTLRALGILVALNQVHRAGAVIGLEEPENALHPGALAVLVEVLREALQRNQVLLTTQSPDLISSFAVDELRVVERVDGLTQIARVQESQRQAIEEQLFSAGDLLRIEGLHAEPSTPEGRPPA
jgi:predicted ATPase